MRTTPRRIRAGQAPRCSTSFSAAEAAGTLRGAPLRRRGGRQAAGCAAQEDEGGAVQLRDPGEAVVALRLSLLDDCRLLPAGADYRRVAALTDRRDFEARLEEWKRIAFAMEVKPSLVLIPRVEEVSPALVELDFPKARPPRRGLGRAPAPPPVLLGCACSARRRPPGSAAPPRGDALAALVDSAERERCPAIRQPRQAPALPVPRPARPVAGCARAARGAHGVSCATVGAVSRSPGMLPAGCWRPYTPRLCGRLPTEHDLKAQPAVAAWPGTDPCHPPVPRAEPCIHAASHAAETQFSSGAAGRRPGWRRWTA